MRGKTCSEGGEPEGIRVRVCAEAFLQGEEKGGAGHIAVAAEDFAGFGEVEAGEGGFEGFDDIAAAGVSQDLVGLFWKSFKKDGDGLSGEVGDAAVELVFEFSGGVNEADFLAIGGDVVGVEVFEFPSGFRGGLAGEEEGGGAITEEAEGDEDAGVVIDVEGGGGGLDGDDCDVMVGVRGEVSVGGAESGDGGAATEAYEIAQVGIGAEAEAFGNVAGGAGAEVAGAGAEEEGIDFLRCEAGFSQGFGECFGGECGGVDFEGAVQRLCVLPEDGGEIGGGELAVADAGVAVGKDFFQQRNGAGFEAGKGGVGLECQPCFRLGEGVGRVGGG